MKRNLKEVQQEIIYQTWQEHADRFTMQELAEVFGVSLPTFYRAVRKFSTSEGSTTESQENKVEVE